jgi:excisionase family DNA binding protein
LNSLGKLRDCQTHRPQVVKLRFSDFFLISREFTSAESHAHVKSACALRTTPVEIDMPNERLQKTAHPVLITFNEACARRGCSRSHLYNLIAEGSVEAVKEGRRTMIKVASLDAGIARLPPARVGKARSVA